mgnify:FL=1
MKNMTFKKLLRFLTLKQPVCLLEFSLKNAVSSAIIAQKIVEKTSMSDIAHQLTISTSTVIHKLNDFRFKHDFSRLLKIKSWNVETVRGVTVSIGKWRWALLHKILTGLISSLFLKAEHKLSSRITFFATIELFVVRWKSLLWICLVLIMI